MTSQTVQSVTLAPFTAEDFAVAGAAVSADAEGMRRLAYYGSQTENWQATQGATRKALSISSGTSTIGFIDLETTSDGSQAAFSYYIRPEFRGQGFAVVVLGELLSWLAENTRVSALFGYVEEDNRPSVAALERANFRYETKYRDMLTYTRIIFRGR